MLNQPVGHDDATGSGLSSLGCCCVDDAMCGLIIACGASRTGITADSWTVRTICGRTIAEVPIWTDPWDGDPEYEIAERILAMLASEG